MIRVHVSYFTAKVMTRSTVKTESVSYTCTRMLISGGTCSKYHTCTSICYLGFNIRAHVYSFISPNFVLILSFWTVSPTRFWKLNPRAKGIIPLLRLKRHHSTPVGEGKFTKINLSIHFIKIHSQLWNILR